MTTPAPPRPCRDRASSPHVPQGSSCLAPKRVRASTTESLGLPPSPRGCPPSRVPPSAPRVLQVGSTGPGPSVRNTTEPGSSADPPDHPRLLLWVSECYIDNLRGFWKSRRFWENAGKRDPTGSGDPSV